MISPKIANTIMEWSNMAIVVIFFCAIGFDMIIKFTGCTGHWRSPITNQIILLLAGGRMSAAVFGRGRFVTQMVHNLLAVLIFGSRHIIGCGKPLQTVLIMAVSTFAMIVDACVMVNTPTRLNGNKFIRAIERLIVVAAIFVSMIGAWLVIYEISDYTVFETMNILLFWAINLVVSLIYHVESAHDEGSKPDTEIKKTQ